MAKIFYYKMLILVHLATDAILCGLLDKFNAFPFDNYLKVSRKLVGKSELPLPQIIRKFSEIHVEESYIIIEAAFSLKHENNKRPLPKSISVAKSNNIKKFIKRNICYC